MTERELVMYVRNFGCPFVSIARSVLSQERVACREINIDQSESAKTWLLETVGFLSVPTLVAAERGQDTPFHTPAPLPQGQSPRGINRGSLITEPDAAQLTAWLRQNGFLAGSAPSDPEQTP